jgi:hypothetical protein
MRPNNCLNETKIVTGTNIDLVNPGKYEAKVPVWPGEEFKPEIPSNKTVNVHDDIMLVGNTWGVVEKTLPKKVKVNLNPGMGNRPNIVTEKYDQVIFWKYEKQYRFVNKNRIIV